MKLKRPLRGSEQGADIRMVQRALNRWTNGVPIPVTAIYDPATEVRMVAFQRDQKISPASGKMGQRTLDKLWPFFDAYGRWRYRAFKAPKPKPEPLPLIEPRQGFGSLDESLHEAYSEGRRRDFTDLGTYVDKPGDHGIGPPCFAFDLGHESRFNFLGWGYLKARRLATFYVKHHQELNINYVILGDRIWSRRNGWYAYTRDRSHDFHIHVSGVSSHR